MDLKITVKGESSITRPAEQGVLRLTILSEGSELETVSKDAISRTNELRELLKTLSTRIDDGTGAAEVAVTKIASTFLRTTNHTPHDKDNLPLPKVYQASMSSSIVFSDISQLSQVVSQLVNYSNVEINSIDWSLSKASQKALRSQMRKEAIRDAITKANDIAGEVGRKVYPVEIMDEGESAVMQHPPAKRSLFGSANGGLFGGGGPNNPPKVSETLDLSPPDIQVTSLMNVEFQSVPEK
ncbi:hypothetical protein DPV78_006078 [Talaromyces pinophilus]|nr:hypothetical protein DPV78_006078 [Talaromyces pinophilus]